MYTFPSDGYVNLRAVPTTSKNSGFLYIYGSNSTNYDFIMAVGNNTDNLSQSDNVYVKAGMKCYTQYTSDAILAFFIPLE